ncbi:MAG TPA: VOC family protein [Candidatus Saccharimonadales bacterium]|nr:VOC family protein [Candidatus Saccharimonadales bacterium]
MKVTLNPYLGFKGDAHEAVEFYHGVFGGKLTVTTFKEAHASQDPSMDNLVMHAQLEGDNGFTLMAADTPPHMEYKPGTNITLSLSGDDEATLRDYFEKLSAGGKVTMPLEKAMWGDIFGMFTDKFGIGWLVNINAAKA